MRIRDQRNDPQPGGAPGVSGQLPESRVMQAECVRADIKAPCGDSSNCCWLDALPSPVVVIGSDTSITYVNPALEVLTGFSSAELLGGTAPYPWSVRRKGKERIGETAGALSAQSWRSEELLQKKNGEQFWADITVAPVGTRGHETSYIASWSDISRRKQAEAAVGEGAKQMRRATKANASELAEARRYADAILQTVTEPLIVLDPDFKVVSANAAFYRVFQVTPGETEGRFVSHIGNCQWDNQTLRDLLQRVLPQTTTPTDFEVELHLPTVGRRTVLLTARPVVAADNDSRRILLALEDITDLRRAARVVQEARQQLVRHQKLAMLGRVAGGLGHELRNPLRAIKDAAYFLDMLLEDPEPEVKDMLHVLQAETAAAERIINSLLDLAWPRRGERHPLSINNLVEGSVARQPLPENIDVICHLDRLLPDVLADAGQLARVLDSIISNAVQAMPNGGRLSVSCRQDGEGVAVSVSDTGMGIENESIPRLFEPFFTTKARSIGLGLSIAKGLVEEHGGTIEVKSAVGEGSTFTLWLPLDAEAAQ